MSNYREQYTVLSLSSLMPLLASVNSVNKQPPQKYTALVIRRTVRRINAGLCYLPDDASMYRQHTHPRSNVFNCDK